MILRLGKVRTILLVLTLGASMFGVGLMFTRTGPAQTAPPAGRGDTQPALLTSANGGDLADVIASLQKRLTELPGDHTAWAALATVYVQQAAVTGDPSYYTKAEGALSESLDLEPADRNSAALTGQAALAAARHDFDAAARYARQSQRINPYNAANQGILSDAHQQLGRYSEAQQQLQTMLDLQPGVPAFTRASYAFELRGNQRAAEQALQRALKLASRPSDKAYCLLYLGELAWNSGKLALADQYYLQGLEQDPDYTALSAGRAKVAAARGDVDSAVTLYEGVLGRTPIPTYLIAYSEFLRSLGRNQQAARQEAVIDATRTLFEAEGVSVDLETALFDANQNRPGSALRAARSAWKSQRSIEAADAYAWALHVNGQNAEALKYSARASRLGTKNALFAFHRGMIEKSLGRSDAARRSLERALSINPHFSQLLAPRAKAALQTVSQ